MIPAGLISQQGNSVAPSTQWIGINGHYASQDPYRNNSEFSFDWQADAIQTMGFNSTRTDILAEADGTISNSGASGFRWARLLGTSGDATYGDTGMYTKLKARNIKLLVMLYDRLFNGDPETYPWLDMTDQEMFDAGYLMANGFVTNYKEALDLEYLELGNEWELFRDIKTGPPGTGSSQYNLDRVRARFYTAGMNAGAKAAMPTIKTIFNTAGYLPTWWMDQVLNQAVISGGVEIDVVGWHWYSEMQPLIKGGQLPTSPLMPHSGSEYTNITDALFDMWGKPVWYTEFGYRWDRNGKTQAENEADQVAMHNEFTAQCIGDPRIVGISTHELLDTIRNGTAHTSVEENYGLVGYNDFNNVGYSQPFI
ncbi:MAG: hypothetical protein ACRDE7_03095, partial [Sphingobacterium sp.]